MKFVLIFIAALVVNVFIFTSQNSETEEGPFITLEEYCGDEFSVKDGWDTQTQKSAAGKLYDKCEKEFYGGAMKMVGDTFTNDGLMVVYQEIRDDSSILPD